MKKKNFINREIGVNDNEIKLMLKKIGLNSIDEMIDKTIPKSIRLSKNESLNLKKRESDFELNDGLSEEEMLDDLKEIAEKNKIYKSYIGQGYYGTILPSVIKRNILENPVWYTSYTPYQAEISQGRLEALLNFQTVIADLTKMEIANASLLDEATAAAEAMIMLFNKRDKEKKKNNANVFFVDENSFQQTKNVLITRAKPLGIEIEFGDFKKLENFDSIYSAFVQYPAADGEIIDYKEFAKKLDENKATLVVAADILSLAILTPPGEWGATVVVGSTQRFGIPMGFGGPHAAYFACGEKYKRSIPGRIIGQSIDAKENKAFRMALQTREQHIKREKATSNICTAQALLATMAGFYAIYHGKSGLERIAKNINILTTSLKINLEQVGFKIINNNFFDTIKIKVPNNQIKNIKEKALYYGTKYNFHYQDGYVSISFDETTKFIDVSMIYVIFAEACKCKIKKLIFEEPEIIINEKFIRKSDFFTADIFNIYRTETEMMRYMKKLERKDFSLMHSMISLGSCTMKLNAATSMLAISWGEFGNIHPFVPKEQAKGYLELINDFEKDLCNITGFAAVSFQPNSGAQGEYAGLMVIKEYQKHNNQSHRNIVLIPASAHGTNPASAVMAGMKTIIIACDDNGNIDIEDLKNKAKEHKEKLSAFMVTYPSTHGVFEEKIIEINKIIHDCGGLVYMDGANMNAQIGYTNPVKIGADICHLNLHKTFGIPHGGGGPGVGPIATTDKLKKYLPNSTTSIEEDNSISVSSAEYGSASILPISYAYIKMLGSNGLKKATEIAILNANYLASSLKDYYDILYTGENGLVAHEMILDCRKFKNIAGITEADIAKRLMDYGFHAPTLSFPVHGTLMVEPTESESKAELDRFISAMIAIYNEIMEIAENDELKENNVLKNAPHTEAVCTADEWNYPYSRQKAAFPLEAIRENKLWPAICRINDAYGDRNLFCTC